MGCPKEFSIKGGMGAALLTQPEKVKDVSTVTFLGMLIWAVLNKEFSIKGGVGAALLTQQQKVKDVSPVKVIKIWTQILLLTFERNGFTEIE